MPCFDEKYGLEPRCTSICRKNPGRWRVISKTVRVSWRVAVALGALPYLVGALPPLAGAQTPASVPLTLTATPASIGEAAGAPQRVTVEAALGSAASARLEVPLTIGGTATRNADYALTGIESILIESGQSSARTEFVITPIRDIEDEGDGETIVIGAVLDGYRVRPAEITLVENAAAPRRMPGIGISPLWGYNILRWGAVDATPPVTNYEIQSQSRPWNANTWTGWTEIAKIPGGPAVHRWAHSKLDPDKVYRYRLRAVNALRAGAWSDVLPRAGGRGAQPLPNEPAGFKVEAGDGEAILSWQRGPASVNGWYYRWKPTPVVYGGPWVLIPGSNAGTTSHTVTGLTNGEGYYFALRASNGPPATSPASHTMGRPSKSLLVIPQARLLDVEFSQTSHSANEGGGAVTVEVVLDKQAGREVTIPIDITPGAGTVATDYTVAGLIDGALVFAIGERRKTFTLRPNQDADAKDEEVGFAFGRLPGGVFAVKSKDRGTITITDDDSTVSPDVWVSLTPSSVTVDEGQPARFAVTLSGAPRQEVVVGYATRAGSATAEADYTETSGTLRFAVTGRLSRAIDVPTRDDDDVEAPHETVTLTLSEVRGSPLSRSGARLGAAEASLSIRDNDNRPPQPTVDLGVRSEGVRPGGVVEVVWNGVVATPPVNIYTLEYQYRNNSSWSGWKSLFPFPGGRSKYEYLHSDYTDPLPVGRYRYRVRAENSRGEGPWSTAFPNAGIHPVADISIIALQGVPQDRAMRLAWQRTARTASITGWETRYRRATGGAWTPWKRISGSDWRTTGHTISGLRNNIAYEFELRAINPGGVSWLERVEATPLLPLSVQFSRSRYVAREGGDAVEIGVWLHPKADREVRIPIRATPGATTDPDDYTLAGLSGDALIFPSGEFRKTFTLRPRQDADMNDEFVTLGFHSLPINVDSGRLSTTAVTIDDDDSASLSVASANAAEGGKLRFTVSLSQPALKAVIINYSVIGGTATAADYTLPSPATLRIPLRSTTGVLEVSTRQDRIDEADETLILQFTGTDLPIRLSTATIIDDDAPPSLSIADASVTEGDSGATNAVFTVTLSAASGKAVSVAYATSNGTAAAGDDYTAASDTLRFAAGETSKTFNVAVTGDQVDEADETFTVTLSSPVNATLSDGSATGTITDDDAKGVTVAPTAVTVTEAAGSRHTATYAVRLNSKPTGEVTITPESGDIGIATVSPSTLTFTTGNWATARTVTVTGVDDAIDNAGDERTTAISHTVSGADYASGVSVAGVAVRVTDDDATPGDIALSVSPTTIAENDGATTVTVTVQGRTRYGVEQRVAVAVAGSGKAGVVGFDAVAGFTIVIPAGAASATGAFTLTPHNDSIDEADETVTISGAASGIAVQAATLTIIDDDILIVEGPTAVRVNEGETEVGAFVVIGAAEDATVIWSGAGEDGDIFRIDGNGPFAFETTPDFENPTDKDRDNVYRVTVKAAVGGGATASLSVTVTVVNVNERPVFDETSYAFELAENRVGPVEMGAVSATDPDADDGLSYAIAEGDGSLFAIDEATGIITYVGPGEDFESEPNIYELIATVTDGDGLSDKAEVTVTITDEDDAIARTRLRRVNLAILPELSRALVGSVLQAVTGRIEDVSPGASGESSYTIAGHTIADYPDTSRMPETDEEALEENRLDRKQALSDSSFRLRLGGEDGVGLWGVGDWRALAAGGETDPVSFEATCSSPISGLTHVCAPTFWPAWRCSGRRPGSITSTGARPDTCLSTGRTKAG